MPSAASNHSNNKLEKQSSITAGGGPIEPPHPFVENAANALIKSDAEITTNANMNLQPQAVNSATSNNNSESNNSIKERGSVSGSIAAGNGAACAPMKQAIIAIEHKIRNLEKRKTKLESYRAIQAIGKELSNDQKAAVVKYEAVIATLDFAREFSKQMVQFAKDAEKEQKKQARKDNIVRAQAETAKIREVLIMQNILNCLTNEAVRADFLNGDNGAVKLDAADLDTLDKFCNDIQTRRPELPEDATFIATAQKVAENFSMTIDGRPRQYGDTTYENLRRIFQQIQECGFLDTVYMIATEPTVAVVSNIEKEEELTANAGDLLLETDDDDTINSSGGTTAKDCSLPSENVEKLYLSSDAGPQLEAAKDDIGQQQQHRSILVEGVNMLLSTPNQQQQQAPSKEQLDIMNQPQDGIQAPPASALPNFLPAASPPAPTAAAVHHVAMYAGQPSPSAPMQQVVPPQLQAVPAGSLIGVPPGPPAPQLVGGGLPPPPAVQALPASVGGAAHVPLHSVPPAHFSAATTVRAVEQGILRQHQHQQYMQQLRPLAEVIDGGSFYFLQDSELDSPDVGGNTGGIPANVGVHQQPGVIYEQLHDGVQQQQPTQEHQQQMLQAPQAIPTQTFINQSFPPMPTGGTTLNSGVGSGAAPENATSPIYQQQKQHQQQQLFSPVSAMQQQQQAQQDVAPTAQLLLSADQTVAAPLMIISRLAAPQTRLPPPLQQQQPIDGVSLAPNTAAAGAGFHYDNAVVSTLNYEQQYAAQQAATSLPPPPMRTSADELQNALKNVMNACRTGNNTNSAIAQNNASATAALTHVLKPEATIEPAVASNKWSNMDVAPSPTQTPRRNEWTSTANSEIATAAETATSNHWSASAEREEREGGPNSAGGERSSYGRGGGARNNNYQQRRDRRDDDRRGGDDRRSAAGSGGGGYRARSNYNNNGSQQNGGGGRGMFYRSNNDGATSTGTGSSYYQNGGGGYNRGGDGSRYDGGGNYRGRGANTARGNNNGAGGTGRSVSSRNGTNGGPANSNNNHNNNASSNNGASSSSSSYGNARQSTRIVLPPQPVGLENKN